MKRSVSVFALASFLTILSAIPSLGAPLTGSGTLPFPGATGDPPRDSYQSAGPINGPYTGTWPGAGPNSPAQPAWWGTFPVTGQMPHTPPAGPSVTGNAHYDFTAAGGYIQGALPIGTYFHFGDLDNGSGGGETFRLTAFDPSGNPITTPWLETPFASSAAAVASDMPNYNFAGGIYDFDGSFVPGNPTISVFLKNNTLIGSMNVTRTSTQTSFILAAPPQQVPEPGSFVLMLFGVVAYLGGGRRR
jgi:hypothetical protein